MTNIPPMPLTGAQVRQVLVDLEARIGSGVAIPDLPFNGSELHAVLLALEGAIVSGGQVHAGTGAPAASLGRNGDVYLRIEAGVLSVYGPKAVGAWPAASFSFDSTPVPPPRRLTLEKVVSGEVLPLDRTPETLAVTEIAGAVTGADATVRFSILYGPTPAGAGTALVTAGTTVALVGAGFAEASETTLDVGVIPAGQWYWLRIDDVVGQVDLLSVGLRFA